MLLLPPQYSSLNFHNKIGLPLTSGHKNTHYFSAINPSKELQFWTDLGKSFRSELGCVSKHAYALMRRADKSTYI